MPPVLRHLAVQACGLESRSDQLTPSGAITALIPVVPATTTYLSCSTARTLANASCCSLIVLLKVALLLGTVSSCAPPRIDFRGAR